MSCGSYVAAPGAIDEQPSGDSEPSASAGGDNDVAPADGEAMSDTDVPSDMDAMSDMDVMTDSDPDPGDQGPVAPIGSEWQGITPPVPPPWAGGSFSGGPAPYFGLNFIDGAKADAPETLYVNFDHSVDAYNGIWKSIDGGESWSHLSASNGLAAGGFLRVDPTDSDIVYAGVAQGGSGVCKTVNGGTSWSEILPDGYERDVYALAIDPHNHLHLLLTFHGCQVDWPLVSGGVNGAACGVLESTNGGETWVTHAAGGWSGNSQLAFFVGEKNDGSPDSAGSHWLVSNQDNRGLWRTENAGATWSKVGNFDHTHGMQSLYRASNGALYMGSVGKVFRSRDNGRTWSDTGAQSSGDGYGGIWGDGTHVWTMLANTGTAAFGPYRWQMLAETDTTSAPGSSNWELFGTTTYIDGPDRVIYDPINKVLYASQWGAGVYKLELASVP